MLPVTFALGAGLVNGGVETWALDLAARIANERETTIIAHRVREEHAALVPPGVRLVRCKAEAADASSVARVRELAGVYRPHLSGIYFPNLTWGSHAVGALLSREVASLRVAGFCHTHTPYQEEWIRAYSSLFGRIVTVSHESGAAIASRIGADASRLVVKPYGVVVSPLGERRYVREGKLRMVYAGRLSEPDKGVLRLVDVARVLGEREVAFELLIAGEGDERARLEARVGALPEPQRASVRFLGRLAHGELLALWREVDVCLMTSRVEGTSIALLEAMAAGCVPCVTSTSGTAHALGNGRVGIEHETPEGLAHAMADRLSHRSSVAELGHAAHERAASEFSYDRYLDWFRDLLDQLDRSPRRTWPRWRPVLPWAQLGRGLAKNAPWARRGATALRRVASLRRV